MINKLKFHSIGIYHDMPEEIYHADWSLSASGMKNLRVSPLNYWCNHPMNPDYEPKETDALEEGKAWHKRILEGKDAFCKLYAPDLDIKEYPDVLKSGDDLKEECRGAGLKISGTIAETSERIFEANPDMRSKLWYYITQDYQAKHAGKTFLSAKIIRQIESAAQTIEENPKLKEMLDGGKSEVSVFWQDEETGVRMKRRVDYFKDDFICELKSFANQRNRKPSQAVGNSIAEYGYFFDAMCSIDALKTNKFHFLFFQKGNVPHIVLKNFCQFTAAGVENNYFTQAQHDYRAMIKLYAACVAKWGYDKKWDTAPELEDLEDYDIPLWAFN